MAKINLSQWNRDRTIMEYALAGFYTQSEMVIAIEMVKSEQRKLKMLAVWMSNAVEALGMAITIIAFIRALKKAGDSGKYDTVMDAANDADVWADAYEIQQEINENGQDA